MKNKWKLIVTATVFVLLWQALSAQYTGQVNFSLADVNLEQSDGWDVATIEGCYMETDIGKPYLPVKHLHIAIPEDKDVSGIQILSVQQQELTGTYSIKPTQPGQIPGEPEPDFVNPDLLIYNINAQYPVDNIFSPTAGFMLGVHIAGLLYYPITYNPVTQKLYLTTQIQYQLVYANASHNPVKPRRMLSSSYLKRKEEIKAFTENPTDVDNYFQLEKTDNFTGAAFAPDEFPNFNGQAVEYVIITNETLAEGFQEIADWKTHKGVPAVVRTVEWIYGYYPGVDQADKVRNFIIDAYSNWGAEYFALGGDTEQVPVRYAWISHWNNYQLKNMIPNGDLIPADMYFACLDGNWNADGDATYGEANWDRENDGTFDRVYPDDINLDDVDRLPDIKIGRIPVEDYLDEQGELVELNRFKTKFFEYVKTSTGNENNVLLFSQDSDGVYHERMDNNVEPQFPSYTNIVKLYEDYGYTNTDVLNAFNASDGVKKHIICGFGHGGSPSFNACVGSLNRTDMDNLSNSDRSEILFLNHCKSMKWNSNSVAEHFINSLNGGVSVIAYSTLGWTSSPEKFNGPFLQRIYNYDYHIGKAFQIIKKLYQSSSYKDCSLRMDFFSLSLASDPEMPVWTDSPDPLSPLILSVPTSVYTGEQTIAVQISNLAMGTDAMVCLYREGEIYARQPITGTGSTVTANIDCTPNTVNILSDILVTVTAQNYLPVEESIEVTANPAIHLFVSNYTISGDENIDAGETIDLSVDLSNSGLTTANSVYAVLSCADGFITIQNNQLSYGNIAAGGTVVGPGNFTFTSDATLSENQLATFVLTMTDAGNNDYTDAIYLEVNVPELAQRSKRVINTSNGDDIIEAGETIWFDIDLLNNSHSLLQNVNAVLGSTSGFVTAISQSQGAYGDITSFQTATNTNQYCFQVASNYPGEPVPIEFTLDASNGFGQQWQFYFDLLEKPDISGIEIDFRGKLTSIELFWTVYDDVAGYNIYRCDTETGTYVLLNTTGLLSVAYFEDSGLQELTTYYYKVSVVSLTGNESELSQAKKAWTSLSYHPDWLPISVTQDDHGYFWGAPNVYDIENDGEKEIFITSGSGDHAGNEGTLFGFKHDGEELFDIDQNPTSVSGFANIGISMTCQPAIGDIDNDGIVEIVVATRMGDPDDATKRKLFVYKNEDADNDKKPDLMWEKEIAYKNFNGVVLADLDNNSTLEIIIPNQKGHTLEILDYEKNNYPGWPVTTGENPTDLKAVSIPVAVDLDGDNIKEIVIGLEGGIYIWSNDGDDYLGYNPVYTDLGRLDCPVIVANIDNDNEFEILFMSIRNKTGYIYALEIDGNLATNWSGNDHSIDLSIDSQNWAWPPSFVCGDIDLDGYLEIAIADEDVLKVWNHLGDLILDKSIPLLQCQYLQPLIANIDNDATDCEIIIPSNNGIIYAYKLNGDAVLGWPLYLGSTYSIPLIDDIDNDSKNEIVAASGSEIFVWDTEGSTQIKQWGRARLNSYNNGVFMNPCAYNPEQLTIDDDQVWTSDIALDRDLCIESATLTIKSVVSFPSQAKIIIKPGAKLIIDGGKLTNVCAEMWQGIEVWGDITESQYPDANGDYKQGYLEIKNNAIIENAFNAITLWEPENWFSMGGIVKATGSDFINNRRSVEFMSYQNFHPGSGHPTSNLSSFEECNFVVNDNYNSTVEFAYHISMWEVDGIKIKGCSFLNSLTGKDKIGYGIYTMDAEYQVTPTNTSTPVESTFEGFYAGISALNSQSLHPIYVYESSFENNGYGVKLSKSDYATVIFNDFNIGSTALLECPNDFGIGVDLLNCNDYAVEENHFEPSLSITGRSIGVCVNYEASYANEVAVKNNQIYLNIFDGLYIGNEALGNNRMPYTIGGGLQYACNINSNNRFDFYVKDDGIPIQGRHDKAAGNTFTQDINNTYGDFNNQSSSGVLYFYDENISTQEPLYYSPLVLPREATNGNDCLSNYRGVDNTQTKGLGLTAAEMNTYEQQFGENQVNYNGTFTLYESLQDGGDTEGVVIEIETSWPSEMLALRADLLEDSPYLSRRVLKATADNTSVFPDAVIFEILAANPDEMRDEEFLSYLGEKQDPLPQYYIDILRGLAGEISYKTILKCQLIEYKHNMAQAADIIVRNMLNDSICNMDTVRYWLGSIESFASECQIIDSYLQEKDAINAQSRLNDLVSTVDLTAEDSVEFNGYVDLKTLQIDLITQSRNIFMLDSNEKTLLEGIALNSVGIAGTQAQNILAFVYGQEFTCCPEFPDSLTHKNYTPTVRPTTTDPESIELSVFPNPARNWTVFEYNLPYNTGNANIIVYNSKGQVEYSIKVTGTEGQVIWDIRNTKPGTYYYKLQLGDLKKTGSIVII